MLCNRAGRGVGLVRLLVFLPSLIPLFAAAVLWGWLFNTDFGLVNYVLDTARPAARRASSRIPDQALPLTILVSFWAVGSAFLVYLSGLQSIPKDLYEAITVDGAGSLRRFWHVTLPMLSPVILFNLVIGIVLSFQVFDIAWVLTNGGPADATLFWVLFIYRKAFQEFQMGYASALAWLLFLGGRDLHRPDLPHRALLGALRGAALMSDHRAVGGHRPSMAVGPRSSGRRPSAWSCCCRSTT